MNKQTRNKLLKIALLPNVTYDEYWLINEACHTDKTGEV